MLETSESGSNNEDTAAVDDSSRPAAAAAAKAMKEKDEDVAAIEVVEGSNKEESENIFVSIIFLLPLRVAKVSSYCKIHLL